VVDQSLRFAEGTGAGWFDTYYLVTNLSGSWTTATLTYRRATGTVIDSDAIQLPPGMRGTVWANGTAGTQDLPRK
jgi:hypothetical protein